MNQSNPFSKDVQGYWDSRHILFSKFDEWIETDEVGLYSVKAEEIALEIANTITWNVILDGFCGIGGSAIAFARAGKKVITVDIDCNRLNMARNNARLYWVDEKITFIHGNILEIIPAWGYDSIHFDPPWWGIKYLEKRKFQFSDFSPDGTILLKTGFNKTKNIALGVPLNFDFSQLENIWRAHFIQTNRTKSWVWSYTVYFH